MNSNIEWIISELEKGVSYIQIEKQLTLEGAELDVVRERISTAEELFLERIRKKENVVNTRFNIGLAVFWTALIIIYSIVLTCFSISDYIYYFMFFSLLSVSILWLIIRINSTKR